MKIAYFDCPSGASGDMILGALVDAGCPVEGLRAELARLPLSGYRLSARQVAKGGFRATKVDVEVDPAGHPGQQNLPEILGLLERSTLPPPVRAQAARIFRRLAEAEARVHGKMVDEVHFHDVGAVDAIVDVTGAAVGLHLLGVESVHVSALPLGGGMTDGPHGKIPVPAPGTAELLRGFPVFDSGVRAELVTPTGAAILTTVATAAGWMPAMTLESVGFGAGTFDLPLPNVLRCFLGVTGEIGGGRLETIAQVETTIDDMSPQLYEPVMERLFEAGALDVFLTPVIMKRGRPGVVLTALCDPSRVGDLSAILFQESTTIGVRWTERRRIRLEREMVTLPTGYGPVAFKLSRYGAKLVAVTPEFSDVSRIAREKGVPVREVLDQAKADARRVLEPRQPDQSRPIAP